MPLGHHFSGRSASAVAIAVRGKARVGVTLFGELGLGELELHGAQVGVVGIDRREVREDAGTVDALPPEGVVRHPIGVVPGEFLGEEVIASGQQRNLRERTGVAKGVRQPHVVRLHAQLFDEEPLALHELTHQGLGTHHVGVRFHPHAAHRVDPALTHARRQALEQLGVVLLNPGVLLGRGEREGDLRVGVHQGEHVRHRAADLAHGLAHRPEPGRVDVSVANGVHLVSRPGGRGGQQWRQDFTPRGCGPRDVIGVHHIAHPLEADQDLGPARGARVKRVG